MVLFCLAADFGIQFLAFKCSNLIFRKNDSFSRNLGFKRFQALPEVLQIMTESD